MSKKKSTELPKARQTSQQKGQAKQLLKPVKIDTTAAMRIAKGNATPYEKSLMTRNDIWHKIEIYRGASMDKELVMKSILQAVQPIDLIPVRYTTIGQDSYFLIRNCDNALQQLCRLNLIIKTLQGELLLLTITLGYASIHDLKMNIRPLLLALLTKRYEYGKRILNLNNFHRDQDIVNIVFCPLSLPRTLSSVLNIAITDLSNFERLSLRHNELTNLFGMENIKLNISSLDLRNNLLLNMDCLKPLKEMNIKELWLDCNPVCENYSSPSRYIESVRKYCPDLIKLDGIYIGSPSLPISYKTFITTQSREKLIEQFIRHFFTLYDGRDRTILKGIYHSMAVYSMTLDTTFAARFKKAWMNKKTKLNLINVVMENPVPVSDLQVPYCFAQENRNLLQNYHESNGKLYCGSENILKTLKKLPETQHFPETFSYDLIFDSDKCISFTIDGIFRDESDEKFLFNRTFVLVSTDDEEYKVLNDQCLIFCTSIKDLTIDDEIISKKFIDGGCIQLKSLSRHEMVKLMKQMKKITNLNEHYCQKLLTDASWNLRKAIIDFTIQYRAMCIPENAFTI